MTGYQCDVVANQSKYNGMLYEEKGRRILSHTGEKVIVDKNGQSWIIDNFPVMEFKPGEWYDYRILVEANRHDTGLMDIQLQIIDMDKDGRQLEGIGYASSQRSTYDG